MRQPFSFSNYTRQICRTLISVCVCVFSDVSFHFKVRHHHHHHHHHHHLFQTTSPSRKISQKSAARYPPVALPTRSESRARSIRSTSGGPINQKRGKALQLKLRVLVVMKTSLVAPQKIWKVQLRSLREVELFFCI